MKNSVIRYKGYSFEHNPETLRISTVKSVAEQDVILGRSIVREFGEKNRIITGEGKIVGEDCMYQFLRLYKVKEERGSGVLSIPSVKPFFAFFRSLEFLAEPAPNLITYRFVFVEEGGKSLTPAQSSYTLEDGEDLWDVSHKFGLAVEKLIELNNFIKRPEEVGARDEVRVC